MKVLVWQDHGNVSVLSGSLSDIKDKVLDVMTLYYPKEDIHMVASSKTENRFEQNVRNVTVDDEQFEVFEFVEITEV